ncbi:MAG: hypothetical protein HZA03_01820 [Nitrospinae bacterium]|nr:hypothetical protein [Nitrospinota bacterium]
MKRDRGFSAPEEIDILSYLMKLKQYWRSFLLAFVVGVCGGYYYLLKTLPLPSTQAVLEIGFPEINSGKYPNGRRFDKNDLVSNNIVRKAADAIPELGQNGRWSSESLSSALSVSEVYPLDIQLAIAALSKPKLSPQEVVSNYEKINGYFPSKFTISFQPLPLMPMSLQKKFVEELVRQYSTFVLESCLPLAAQYNPKGVMPTETDNVATYSYITAVLDEIDDQAAASHAKKTSSTVNAGNPESAKQQNRSIGNDEEFALLSQASNSITRQKLKMEMASIEHLIFNEKTVPNVDEYRNKLANDISLLSSTIDIKKKQAEYKMNLARIPNESAPKTSANLSDNSPQGVDKTVMGMLLSYNSQYYSLINETNAIFDDISRMEGKLIKLKERLKLLDTVGPVPGGTYEARNKALGEHIKLAQSHLAAFINELADNTKAAYAGHRPPVANSAIFSVMASISLLKAILAGCAAVLFLAVFRLLKIVVSEAEAQRRRAAFPAPQEIGGAGQVNIKK